METLDHPHGGLPIRVSLVAFGHNQDLHMKALDMFEGDAWRTLDVQNYLSKDPAAGGVGHTENGSTPTTQICVFSMPEFVDLAVNEYRKIIENRKFARLYGCNRGMHRSDVLVRWLEHALNALKTTDGRQVFEARAFALAEGYGTKGPFNIAGNAISWMTKDGAGQRPWMSTTWIRFTHIVTSAKSRRAPARGWRCGASSRSVALASRNRLSTNATRALRGPKRRQKGRTARGRAARCRARGPPQEL